LPRLVPLHSEYADALREHIVRYSLRLGDLLFGMFGRHEIENTHELARTSIGRGTWREMCRAARAEGMPEPSPEECDPIRIKDLRHFSAIVGDGRSADRTRRGLSGSFDDTPHESMHASGRTMISTRH
jgi:hypothetical protein